MFYGDEKMELEELGRIMKVDAPSILSRRIEAIGATEEEIARDALAGMRTIRLAERDLTLPGLTRHTDLIIKALAEFKNRKKRNVMPLQYAKSDDIVIEPIRPEQFGLDNYEISISAAGSLDIIPQGSGTFSVDDDEMFIFTDWAEHADGEPVTALQATIDGTQYQPLELRAQLKFSDVKVYELDYPWIADVSVDINGKAEASSGTTEMTPYGVHICLGKKIASLT